MNTLILRVLRFGLPSMAFRMALMAFSDRSCSVFPGGCAQERNVLSQSRAIGIRHFFRCLLPGKTATKTFV